MRFRAFLLGALAVSVWACGAVFGAPVADSASKNKSFPNSSAAADSTALAHDSLVTKDTITAEKIVYEYIFNPAFQILAWPLETFVDPVVQGVLYPIKPPLRYFLNESVIDRTIQLISFGQDNRVMLYPTLNLAPGTGSSVGLTLRHAALLGYPHERLMAAGNLYVNGDWRFRTYVNSSDVLGSGFTTKQYLQLIRMKNTSVNQPGTNSFFFYADTSNLLGTTLSHLIFEKVGLRGLYQFRDSHFGKAPPGGDTLESSFFKNDSGKFDPQMRALDQNWQDHGFVLSLYRDTRNNENIPLEGSDFQASYHYHLTTHNHDYHGWEVQNTSYFTLGKERYEISAEEERRDGGLSMEKLKEKLALEGLRHELFNRKVIALHLYASQVFELPGNHMPVNGLQTLGNDTPMRGYAGSRFRDYTILSIGGEYRFPILRLVDGMVFNEYGEFGRSWDKIDYIENLRNSWGFGIRVRRPDLYLFRLQLGFHGDQGIELNMSVDEPY